MKPIARIIKKIIEFIGCVACLGTKFWTDIETRRVYYTRQKYSREWSLLNSIFWNSKGDAFAWITYGGYSIITLLFGISICIDSKSRPTYAEKIFLLIGSLMFFGVGGLVLASIDQVPDDLIDNAIVLGVLSFIVAFMFLIDMSEKMGRRGKTDATQTDTSSIDRHFVRNQNVGTVNSELNLIEHDENERRNQSMRSKASDFINIQSNPMMNAQQQMSSGSSNSYHIHTHSNEENNLAPSYVSEDVVQSKTYPTSQMPTVSKINKQYPTIINHFESEPYKKILNRSQRGSSLTRYHDSSQFHHENPSFYDDFNKFRQDSYYQGPKVDQVGKLMVIRDYSNERHTCNCQHSEQDDSLTIKSGYVSQVAKIWDDRTKTSQELAAKSVPKDTRNTHV